MAWYQKVFAWARENKTVALISGVALGLGTIGLSLFGISSYTARRARLAEEDEEALGDQVVYGWLDMLDGNASRYPLQTTNVRIGRHRDNDICLMNDFDLAAACAAAFRCRQADASSSRTSAATTASSSTRSSSNRTI